MAPLINFTTISNFFIASASLLAFFARICFIFLSCTFFSNVDRAFAVRVFFFSYALFLLLNLCIALAIVTSVDTCIEGIIDALLNTEFSPIEAAMEAPPSPDPREVYEESPREMSPSETSSFPWSTSSKMLASAIIVRFAIAAKLLSALQVSKKMSVLAHSPPSRNTRTLLSPVPLHTFIQCLQLACN